MAGAYPEKYASSYDAMGKASSLLNRRGTRLRGIIFGRKAGALRWLVLNFIAAWRQKLKLPCSRPSASGQGTAIKIFVQGGMQMKTHAKGARTE